MTLSLLRSFLSLLTTMYCFSLARVTTSSSLIPGLTFVVVQPKSRRYSSSPYTCSSSRTVGRSMIHYWTLESLIRKFLSVVVHAVYRYFLKYLRHFLHWKRFSEIFLSGRLQNGHVSITDNLLPDPDNFPFVNSTDSCAIEF